MKKRILSMLLVLLMVLAMVPVMASAETATPEIKSVQMVLGSILNINLKADLKGNPAENYTMEVTVGTGSTQILSGKAEGDLYVYTADLMAHQMTDSISIVLKNGETVVDQETWTVAGYVDAIAADAAASAEIKALAEAMYNYGQYAAYYKNGGSDPAIAAVEGAAAVGSEQKLELRVPNGALGAVASLYLDEACDLSFKFNKEAMTGLTLYVDGQAVTAAQLNDTQVQYKIPEILPQDYDVKHIVQVYSGEELVYDLSYSVLSYVYQCQKVTASSYQNLQKLLKAMNLYGAAADAYCDTLPVFLTMQNAGTPELFANTVNAAPNKEYILAEDLDWTGLATTDYAVTAFGGILDGQGHSIKGFTMAVGAAGENDFHTCLFGINNGTIKNIAFDYNVAAAAGNSMGLVAKNNGTIENLFVKAAFAGYSWTTGAIVATNNGTGTVKNSIASVSSTMADQPAKDRLGSVVGVDYNGKIINCYAVNTANAVATPYTDTWGSGDYTGSAVYGDNSALLAAVTALSAADGWGSYWSVTDAGILFNGKLVIADPCTHVDASPMNGLCDLCGKALTPPEGTYFVNMTTAGTVADFAALIQADPDGIYYLTEDLDWTGLSTANHIVPNFDGVLNGQGHSIKGFTIGVGAVGEEYHTCLFGTNNGTIENIAFDYSLAQAAGNSSALIAKNYGTVANLYVKAAFASYSWTTAAIVATNYGEGTVRNCMTAVSSTMADQPAKDRLGSVVGVDYNGKIINCYAVNTANAVATPYTDTWGSGDYTGSAVYGDNSALLAAVTALSAEDGWASYWSITEGGIAFNGEIVIAGQIVPPCEHEDSAPIDGVCDLCGETVTPPEGVYFVNSTTAATVADFVALLNGDLDGTFYVTEDLDYSSSGDNSTGIADFAGILDGQGHTVKGIKIKYNSNHDYESNLFKSNSGSIKDIAFDYSIVAANGNITGLVGTNTGVIENVYAKVTMTADACARPYGNSSPLVAINDSATAVIKNCIVDVTVDASVTSIPETYGVVASRNANGAVIENCYYTVTGTSMAVIAYPWSTANNVAMLDASVNALPTENGWGSFWKVDAQGIWFYETLIMAAAPACQHEDSAPMDGICDLCGEAVEAPEGVYFVNSTTAATVADFVALLNGDLDGTFYVTEDLDYSSSGDNSTGIADFAGILDGQGHTVKGIKIKYNSNHDFESNLFKSNSGAIMNIALDYAIVASNGNLNGLIGTNTGMIQNVYAKVTMTADGCSRIYGNSSPLVAVNDGEAAVVMNCIVDVTVDSSVTAVPETYGAVVSRNANGAMVDKCYFKVTGAAMPGIAYPWSAALNNTAALDSVTDLPVMDGWSDYWRVEIDGIWFSNTLVKELEPPCQHIDASHVDGKCDLCGETVALPENTYLINSATAATVADLVTLINGDLDGTFYVTEDLDYSSSGDNSTGIADFAGILDGQGHTVKGIKIKYNSNHDYESNLFKSNSGAIMNIALDYAIVASNGNLNGLIGTNTGMIQNVYAKVTMTADGCSRIYGNSSPLVAVNDGEAAAVMNCIVDVTVDSSVTAVPETYGAVVSRNANGATVDKCYVKVTGAAMPGIAYPWSAALNNTAVLDNSVTSLSAENGWSEYWTANAAGVWFNETQIIAHPVDETITTIAVLKKYQAVGMTGETGSSPLAWHGSSEDDRANIFAWYDFEKLYEEITGEDIAVVYIDSVNELSAAKKYFVLGGALAEEAGYGYDGLTTDNGHKIVKDEANGNIYLYGKSGYGTANAMYAFLKQAYGAEFYSDTVYTVVDNAYSFAEISNATFNPSVDYNWSHDGLLFRFEGDTQINYAYQMRMGFVNYWHIQGGSFHAMTDVFGESYYNNGAVDLNAAGAINTGNAMVITAADYLYDQAKNTGRQLIYFGPVDVNTWSESAASQANLNTYGANSGEYLLFMNAVIELLNTDSKYADIPAAEIVMLAYAGCLEAPTQNLDALSIDAEPARGVSLRVMFAPSGMNINGQPNDTTTLDYYGKTPAYYYGEYAKWQSLVGEDNVFFWKYSTIFNDYLTPVNSLEYIQENYQAIVGSDNYIAHLMDQGTNYSAAQTNFQALAMYLKGQLGKNVNADLDTLITNFCNAYYGEEAGAYIKQLLVAEQAHLNTVSDQMMAGKHQNFILGNYKQDISGCINVPIVNSASKQHNLYYKGWWGANCENDNGAMLQTWYSYITSALDATSDAQQQNRIQVEAIALRYISLKTYGIALISGDTMAQVEADAIALGIIQMSEGQAMTNLA